MKVMSGFNLLELLISLAILGILTLLLIPSYRSLLQRNRTTVVVNQLISAINFSRSQSILQDDFIFFCGSQDHLNCDGQWSEGQIIKTKNQDVILRTFSKFTKGDQLFWKSSLGKNDYLEFSPTGFTDGQDGSFYFCPKFPNEAYGAIIVVSLSGRARIDHDQNKLMQVCGAG